VVSASALVVALAATSILHRLVLLGIGWTFAALLWQWHLLYLLAQELLYLLTPVDVLLCHEADGHTVTKNRRQKDRDQTAHKRKPNKPNTRQEKAPKGESAQQPQAQGQQNQGQKPQRQQGQQKQQNQGQQNQGQQNQGQQSQQGNNKRRNNNNNKRRNNNNNPQQRPGAENNVRPGSNGRGRGVAQKKQGAANTQQKQAGDKQGSRKYAPVVNPQKKENVVKKIFKAIFGRK